MPELPEVETTKRGLEPWLVGQKVSKVVVRLQQLRWLIPSDLHRLLKGQHLDKIERRAKYLLFRFEQGTLIGHLGMSGRFTVLTKPKKPGKHEHYDIVFKDGLTLRYHDPRRFGALLWTDSDPMLHPLICKLGPEPLKASFNANYLLNKAQGRKTNIKNFLMNAHIVVGLGNIYVNEALFLAKIHPEAEAGKVTLEQFQELVPIVKDVLRRAIRVGGTTLRDFKDSAGKTGYFTQQLNVYGRDGLPCTICKTPIDRIVLGQRSTFYCQYCQLL